MRFQIWLDNLNVRNPEVWLGALLFILVLAFWTMWTIVKELPKPPDEKLP